MRRYWIFVVVASSFFVSAISSTTIAVAFPELVRDLGSSLVLSGWVLSVYQLVSVCVMPIFAKLSDSFGRKFTFILCTLLFAAGSILCSFAPNAPLLIAARVVQAVGGGGFLPSASGIIAEYFPDQRQRMIGLFASLNPLGAIIGPNIGGWIVNALGWRSVFWINIPLGLAEGLLAWWLIRADQKRTHMDMDYPGAVLLAAGLSAFMIGLSLLDVGGQALWGPVIACWLISAITLVSFYRHEKRTPNPLVNLKLIFDKPFRETNIFNSVVGACNFGVFPLMPLYLTTVYGIGVVGSGALLTPRSIGQFAGSTITSFLIMKLGYRKPVLTGTFILMAVLIVLGLEIKQLNILGFEITSLAIILGLMFGAGLGMGIIIPPSNNACIELLPDNIATITSVRGMVRQMGGALMVNICTLVMQMVGDVPKAFTYILIGQAVLFFIVLPAVFVMPAHPSTVRAKYDTVH